MSRPEPSPAALLFDLDGTLIDSIELILGSARYAFDGFAGRAPTDEEWRAGIGRPLQTVLREYAPDEAEAHRLFTRYREYQLEHHDRLVSAYGGVVDTLRGFAEAGHPMALVTSKSDWMAVKALVHVGLAELIPVVVGCDTCANHKPHPEPVERALTLLGVAPSSALFVGDSPHDVQSGLAAGVMTVGVTWGAFDRHELEKAGADVVIDRIEELPEILARFPAPTA
jgi:pyrophosphatase PpaX